MRRAAAALGLLSLSSACSGASGPPRHPVAEMTARAAAKADLVDLVVSDAARAGRLRQIYREAWEIGRDYDRSRAGSLRHAYAVVLARTTAVAQNAPPPQGAVEQTLVPPLAVGRAAFARYTALMLEARSLLTSDEFRKLDAVR